jgi:hypothetical protein
MPQIRAQRTFHRFDKRQRCAPDSGHLARQPFFLKARHFVIIAQYREDELEAVAALVNAAYRGETSRAGWTSEVELLGAREPTRAGCAPTLPRRRALRSRRCARAK